MGSNRRFYWIKLYTNFFGQREIKSIRRNDNGLLYIVIYLKLLLLSANSDGYLRFESTEDTLIDELSIEIDEDPNDVTNAIKELEDKKLLEISSDDEYFLNHATDMVGSETASAQKMRRLRAERKKETSQSLTMLHNVTQSDTEIDKEIEIEKNIKIDDIEQYTSKINSLIVNQVSSSSIINFIDHYGLMSLELLIEQIPKSEYLMKNINFNHIEDKFLRKAIMGEYKTYNNKNLGDDEPNEYGKVPPLRF